MSGDRLTTCLWFDGRAEEAAAFYTSVFPESKLGRASGRTADGAALVVEFELRGRPFVGINGGPGHPYTDAVSFMVWCDDQAEIDRYWAALTEGGEEGRCGWLTDRFGVSWQVLPRDLGELLGDDDREKAGRATEAMLGMRKLDVAELRRAHAGG